MDRLPLATVPAKPAAVLAISAAAAREFHRMREKREKPEAVLRVRVVPESGCGDYRYAMGIEPQPREGDLTVSAHGITVIVDLDSVEILRGSTLDYSDALIDGGFKLDNPNARSMCGCGQSFSLTGRAIKSEHAVRGAVSL